MISPASPPIPDCLGPVAAPTPPSWRPPPGCWDTIFHVLGPQARYPYWPQRRYTPPTATLAQYWAMLQVLGLDHAIVAHANTQGPNNDIYLEAVAQAPERLVAVVKVDETLTLAQARQLHRRGARGARFAFHPMAGAGFNLAAFHHLARLAPELGWFLQLHVDDAVLPELVPVLAGLPVNVVLDHYARVSPAAGPAGPGMQALLALAKLPHVWVKLSGADRVSALGYPYADVRPLTQALLEVAADRLLWGTDWPHTGYFQAQQMPDDGLLFEAFIQQVPQEAERIRILRDNPRRLLGWAGAA